MTDSDPVIAEIDLSNLPVSTWRTAPVHLSDAPLVADLLEAAKDAYRTAVVDWGSQRQLPTRVAYRLFAERAGGGMAPIGWKHAAQLLDAIRAIEQEWTP